MNFDQENLASVLPELPREQLEQIVLQQASRIQTLQAKISRLEMENFELKQTPFFSTAPFRRPKDKLSKTPKKSGQKKGHKGSFRKPPVPTQIIDVPLEFCPDCFSKPEHIKNHTQTIEEIPVITVEVIQINTQSGFCKKCKKKVRSSHPLQVSKAVGAASVSLGPNAVSLAIELQSRFHLTKRKTCKVLKEFFGINLSSGGLVDLSHRTAEKLRPEYDQLIHEIQCSSHIHADETGWYVGKTGDQLYVFTNDSLTLYRIAETRNREMVKSILGDYKGVLISDCLNIYDDVNPLQQKCYSHHLKAIEEARKKNPERYSAYLEEIKLMLKTAMTLKTLQSEIIASDFSDKIKCLETWASNLLTLENLNKQLQPEEESVRQRLFKQHDHLFEFLKHTKVEATNNQAERQLRPAVIARKLSCGNRTEKGARTWEVLQSLAVTSSQRDESFKDLIKTATYRQPP